MKLEQEVKTLFSEKGTIFQLKKKNTTQKKFVTRNLFQSYLTLFFKNDIRKLYSYIIENNSIIIGNYTKKLGKNI